jgi:hypothetical protein
MAACLIHRYRGFAVLVIATPVAPASPMFAEPQRGSMDTGATPFRLQSMTLCPTVI